MAIFSAIFNIMLLSTSYYGPDKYKETSGEEQFVLTGSRVLNQFSMHRHT